MKKIVLTLLLYFGLFAQASAATLYLSDVWIDGKFYDSSTNRFQIFLRPPPPFAPFELFTDKEYGKYISPGDIFYLEIKAGSEYWFGDLYPADISGNGKVDLSDVIILLKFLAGEKIPTLESVTKQASEFSR